ncbi:helix-turn-helix domain-containing protein [Bosea sp. NPDC055594]
MAEFRGGGERPERFSGPDLFGEGGIPENVGPAMEANSRESHSMGEIPLTRCQVLIPFAAILDDLGAPSASLLSRFRLPSSLVEKADHYVPILPAIRFAEAAQRAQGIVDFGFQASREMHFGLLSEKLRTVIGHAPTLLVALQQACKWASVEDTNLKLWLERCDDRVLVCSKLAGTAGLPHLEHSQWFQLVFSIHIVRQFTGPHWSPATIAFEARYTPSIETQSCWPHSRFLSGQHASWIDVPVSYLGRSIRSNAASAPPFCEEDGPSDYEFVGLLKMMLPSYLDEGAPVLPQVAEMAGLSPRSLQRRLSQAGVSYTDLVASARFENASKRLRDTDARIVEIALSSGYTDHAHFTRAFRRMTGVTPKRFREQAQQESGLSSISAF